MNYNEDAKNERANDLEAANFNGIERVIVRLVGGVPPTQAELEVTFINALHVNTLLNAGNTAERARSLLPVRGGHRIRAGAATGQVRTIAVNAGPTADSLFLLLEPIGDYSTYTLSVEPASIDPVLALPAVNIDPLFSEIGFKFRPGCFDTNCSPEWDPAPPPKENPAIDYLAKDYESFRHTMIVAMMQRVPDWQVTSEVDLDQVIIDLTSAVGDELSDYQDRVMSEAYLATCRKRVSLARHARLMDYHVYQGNQASTWIVVVIDPATVAGTLVLPEKHRFWTGEQVMPGYDQRVTDSVVFSLREPHNLHTILNTLRAYTWDDAKPALKAGATTADLVVDTAGLGLTEQQGAQLVADLVNEDDPKQFQVRRLVLQQWLNPATGTENGVDPTKRQLLELLEDGYGAEVIEDSLRGRFLVRVRWREEDRLQGDFSVTVFLNGVRVADVTRFHGNLVRAHHGEFATTTFRESTADLGLGEFAFERTDHYGVLCRLPYAPLAYLPRPPGSDGPPFSTLCVNVSIPGGGTDTTWDEQISLVHSGTGDEDGDHFAVETDEHQRSMLRFGNGVKGRLLPTGSVVTCEYQVGQGHDGNVGIDTLANTESPSPFPADPVFLTCWNPFDVTDGVDPEPADRVRRNAPEAYRARQLRAVTLEDYVLRAKEVPGVSRAAAAYRWTGSWRTVRVAIDPEGTTELENDLREEVFFHLEAVRLIGEDLEIRPPRFVPLDIEITVCIAAEFWPEHVRFVLEQELSNGYTPDGRKGFFHPDEWTFGQRIHRSQLAGRVQGVAGVEHVVRISWRRFNEPTPGLYADESSGPDELFVGPDEIIQVENDPDHLELRVRPVRPAGGKTVSVPVTDSPAPTFPRDLVNRPALPRISYRLGAYADILDAMLRQLNADLDLSRWTHRQPDDPGIALIESAAIVADILTFYQEHYANEAFLRTAQWRESIQELVRLTGYRLAPGIGGSATFAFELRGKDQITIPAAFPIKAELEASPDPVDFLTTAECTGYAQFGRFRLYRERIAEPGLTAGRSVFEIVGVGGASDSATLDASDLKKGDKLVIVAPPPAWLDAGSTIDSQKAAQIVKVSKVTHVVGRLVVEIEGSLSASWSGSFKAYRVNRSFRHFGHNTPAMTVYQTGSGDDITTEQTAAHTDRHVTNDPCYGAPSTLYTSLPKAIIPLDQEVGDLSLGNSIVVEAYLTADTGEERLVAVVHTIKLLKSVTMFWGNVSGPSTWVEIAGGELVSDAHAGTTADIRQFRIHEVTSPELSLADKSTFPSGELTNSQQLFFYGTEADAELLVGRAIYLHAVDGRSCTVRVQAVDATPMDQPYMRQVTLDQVPEGFTHEDFDESAPTVEVFGNLLETTQGKQEKEVALGNGDNRQVFQTFKVPKAPLTYLLDASAAPPRSPELVIRVSGREWSCVDSLFGLGPKDEVYVVRQDSDANSYVQFGDGDMGARLPSGVNNVVALYRTGTGALGPPKEGTKATAGTRLDGLDKLAIAGEATGGASREDGNKARDAAPGLLQSLGRLVSMSDYESETLQIGGVVTASASWATIEGVPMIELVVLLERAQQSDEQFLAVEEAIRESDRARGPLRHPIHVTQCELRYVYLILTYAPDPALDPSDIESAIRAALGLVDDEASERIGLFGLRARRLGELEYASRVEARVQNVAGVVWCRVEQMARLSAADDPTTLSIPSSPVKHAVLACAPNELLQLHFSHVLLLPTNP